GLHGTIDIPQQGARQLALSGLSVRGQRVHFELAATLGTARFEGLVRGDSLAGSFAQGGFTSLFHLERASEVGVGPANSAGSGTTEDFAGDAWAAVAFLRSRPDIDRRHIGLLGHSEGGLIAPRVASRSTDVAFVILLAAPAVPGEQILLSQGQLISRVQGA